MIRTRALASLAVAGLLTACNDTEIRTPTRIVMKGPMDRVLSFAVPATEATHAHLTILPRDERGAVEATLILPPRTRGDKAFSVMKTCLQAKLSCAFHGETVTRTRA